MNTDITLSWRDNEGAHTVAASGMYLRADPIGYLDNLRNGEMWNISVLDADQRDVTNQYL